MGSDGRHDGSSIILEAPQMILSVHNDENNHFLDNHSDKLAHIDESSDMGRDLMNTHIPLVARESVSL